MGHVGDLNQNNVESLWTLHKNVKWDVQEERVQFLIDIGPYISDCAKSEIPDLLGIFTKGEIDCLLTDTVQFWAELGYPIRDHFIDFLIRARYRDVPECDEAGYFIQSYTTPVHRAAQLYMFDETAVLYRLFKVYNRVDANFVDESGLTHLHVACMSGHDDAVENFLACKQDPNCVWTETGETPLHLAAKYGHKDVIVLLLKAGADPNVTDMEGKSALHAICKAGGDAAHEVVEVLFKNVYYDYQLMDVDAREFMGRTPLNLALQHRPQEKLVKVLLKYCHDPNIADHYHETPAHIICKRNNGHIFLEKFIGFCNALGFTVELNGKDLDGNTPLHMALKKKHQKMMRLLLLKGADPNVPNNLGWSVMHLIFQKERIDFYWVHMILTCTCDQYRAGVLDRQNKEGATLLHWAVRNKKTKRIDYLMEKRANPDVTNNKGLTVMHTLCQDEYEFDYQAKMIAKLLEHGADPNVPSPRGYTALHVICKKAGDKVELAEMFLDLCIKNRWRKVEIDALDNQGFTPLYWALKKNNQEVAKLLLNKGARPYLQDTKGLTPLHYICQRDEDDDLVDEFFRICEERGEQVEVNSPDHMNNTPLHLAITGRCKQHVIDVLLRRGADPTLTNATGWNALHFACKRKADADIVAKLLFDFADELDRWLEVDPRDNASNTPLHLAAKSACSGVEEVFRILLDRGADPNARDLENKTPLHIVAARDDIGDYFRVFAQAAAPAAQGEVATVYATSGDNVKALMDVLLRWGAEPNAVDAEGNSALHNIALRKRDEGVASHFFEITDELGQRVELDCQNDQGDTPLHLVLRCFDGETNALPELLLRRGADPNRTNGAGLTPLHSMCNRSSYWQGMGELIFQIVAERNLRVEIEARDGENRTPLMRAVANVDLGMVGFLLERGASVDKDDFVFPDYIDFEAAFREIGSEGVRKVKLAAGILRAVEMLEDSGFELEHESTLTIFKLFANHELYEVSEQWSYRDAWSNDELQARRPEQFEMVPGLTLDQFMRLPIPEASRRLDLVDFYNFADRFERESGYITHGRMDDDCVMHLCEILSREIFERWAAQAVYDMTGMPITCCLNIASAEKLMNKDLWRMCLASMKVTDEQMGKDALLRVLVPRGYWFY